MSQQLPTVYHKAKTGAIYQWTIWTEGSKVKTEYGLIDGKKIISEYEAGSTNDGRANARDPIEQAEFEAQAAWQQNLDRKYSKTVEEAEEMLSLPMLAHPLEKKIKHLTFPCDIQPKLDGLRALIYKEDGEVFILSRQGKFYDVPHIAIQVRMIINEGDSLDGELYSHDPEVGFQTITSWVKKNRKESAGILYNVYDFPKVAGEPNSEIWSERRKRIEALPLENIKEEMTEELIPRKIGRKVEIVPTYTAYSLEDIQKYHDEFVAEGYEGAIVRNHHGVYTFGYRSENLLKVKAFQDEEYKIVDATSGIGKFENCVIWVCEDAETSLRFNVVPKGTLQEKADWFANRDKYIGKMLKVQYFNKTDIGLPRFPVGVGIRIPEDM